MTQTAAEAIVELLSKRADEAAREANEARRVRLDAQQAGVDADEVGRLLMVEAEHSAMQIALRKAFRDARQLARG